MNIENIILIIDKISDKLKVPTEKLFELLVRSGRFKMISSLYGISILILLIMIFIIVYFIYKKNKRKYCENIFRDKKENLESLMFGFCMIFSFIFLVTLLLTGVNIHFAICWFADPEAYGLVQLMTILK